MPVGKGFILSKDWYDSRQHGLCFEYWVSTDQGPFQLIFQQQSSVFFVTEKDLPTVKQLLNKEIESGHWRYQSLTLKSFTDENMVGIYFTRQNAFYRARSALRNIDIYPLESDIQPQQRFLMERFITAGIDFEYTSDALDKQQPQRIYNPRIRSGNHRPQLSLLSLDIETSMDGRHLYSIGMMLQSEKQTERLVLMVNLNNEKSEIDYLTYFSNEKDLLTHFIERFQMLDPDIVTGWNVINFDLRFLQKKCEQHGLALRLGRLQTPLQWRTAMDNEQHFLVDVPGRAVLDGIETMRSATYNFESFSLNAVAKQLLGKEKLFHGSNRGDDIEYNFQHNKPLLAEYNLIDCELVLEIFAHCHLINFSIERAFLTGLNIDRFGGSVAAFDNRYLPLLHRNGYIAPNIPQTPENIGSPGGYVMDSKPGIYHHVLVLDFKSLYPSIIRTFNIDPQGLIEGLKIEPHTAIKDQQETKVHDPRSVISGFNGAVFSRNESILPQLIEHLWQARDRAKRENNPAMSQAIKILMNSFYGVLGTPGCRFFDFRLPSSITLRGHQILYKTKAVIEQKGYQVIYGDTDSVFVWLKGFHQKINPDTINDIGQSLASELNQWWRNFISEEYQLTSHLELEFETQFQTFIMPTIRGSERGSKKRYAGLQVNDGREKLIFKGLESVRTDWTLAAREFQTELYRRVFYHEEFQSFIVETVAKIQRGELDEKLMYRKRIRRKLDSYQRNVPPHIQAARKAIERDSNLQKAFSKGAWVEYFLTHNGPEARQQRHSSLDYDLYIERQIRPIADSLLQFYQLRFDDLINPQSTLF